jgi:hypothetical protein
VIDRLRSVLVELCSHIICDSCDSDGDDNNNIVIESNAQVLPSQIRSTVLSCKSSTVYVARKQTHKHQKPQLLRRHQLIEMVQFTCGQQQTGCGM